MSEELKVQRTREQWEKFEPKLMVKMSEPAVVYALQDAQRDIAALYRRIDQLASTGGEAVAYRHTLHMELDQSHSVVSESEHHPFGVRGENFDDAYSVTTESLYTRPQPAPAGVVVDRELLSLAVSLPSKESDEANRAGIVARGKAQAAIRALLNQAGGE